MNPIRLGALLVLSSSLAWPARAGVRYRYHTETSGGLLAKNYSGSVTTEGDRARIETKSDEFESVRLWNDRGASCVQVDPKRNVHYRSGCGLDDVLRLITRGQANDPPKVTKVQVEWKDEGSAGALAGLPVRKGTIDVSFVTEARMGRDTFPVVVKRRLEVWMSDRLSVPAFHLGHLDELATGNAEVDARVTAALKELGTFPLKLVVTSTKAFDKNHPITETLTTTLSDVEETSPPPALFDVPSGSRYEEPDIRVPGR